jgi:uncharacterized protein YjiS (DUF1127 family)
MTIAARLASQRLKIGRWAPGPALVVSLCRCCIIRGGAIPEGEAVSTIAEWLASLGMSEYAERFAENRIDLSALRHLTDQDLKDIGVFLGHRRKMLAAIGKLAGVVPATPGPSAATEPAPQDAAERRQLTVMFCADTLVTRAQGHIARAPVPSL